MSLSSRLLHPSRQISIHQTWVVSLFTTDTWIALRHPDGFTLPHNLVRETILWEMSLLLDYCSLLLLCVSWLFPPAASAHAEHIRLKKWKQWLRIFRFFKPGVQCFCVNVSASWYTVVIKQVNCNAFTEICGVCNVSDVHVKCRSLFSY